MTAQTQLKTVSQQLGQEITELMAEIPRLKLQRQKLAQLPALPKDAQPEKIAQSIADMVAKNAGRLKGLDNAIASLSHSLETKRRQLVDAEQRERREAAQQKLDQLHKEAVKKCEMINRMSQVLEGELRELRQLERELIPIRHTAMPGYNQPYFFCEDELALPRASWSTVGVAVTKRVLHQI